MAARLYPGFWDLHLTGLRPRLIPAPSEDLGASMLSVGGGLALSPLKRRRLPSGMLFEPVMPWPLNDMVRVARACDGQRLGTNNGWICRGNAACLCGRMKTSALALGSRDRGTNCCGFSRGQPAELGRTLDHPSEGSFTEAARAVHNSKDTAILSRSCRVAILSSSLTVYYMCHLAGNGFTAKAPAPLMLILISKLPYI